MTNAWKWAGLACVVVGSSLLFGCGSSGSSETKKEGEQASSGGGEEMKGTINIDGSSTVYKVTAGVGEAFEDKNPGVKVLVSFSGTGGGFKKFFAGETDISNASRPVKDEEIALDKDKKIEFIEIPVAYDGLTVVVNKENTWAKSLTVEELKKIWEPNSTINNWKDVRAGFPDVPLKLFGPGTDSGTFDFFTKVIVGKEKEMRKDFQPSEDDNVLVKGVEGDKGAMGYFGLAYYEQNMDKLNAVGIDSGSGPVAPSAETVKNLTYIPLSRPEFIYVKRSAYDRPEVKAFVSFYLSESGQEIVKTVGYVPFDAATYERIAKMVEKGATGSLFNKITGEPVEAVLGSKGY